MALFRRNKKDLTPEFQEYYQTPTKRSGTAWLLAAVALLVGAALIVGLFYAGRWAYREIAGDDKPATTASNTDLVGGNAQVLQQPSGTNNGSANPASPTPAPGTPPATPGTPSASPPPAKSPTPTPPPAKSPTPSPTPPPTPPASTKPTTPPTPPPSSLPNTGPDVDL